MNQIQHMRPGSPSSFAHFTLAILSILLANAAKAQLPSPQSIPQAAAETDALYQPQALLPGGIVVPLYPPNSKFLNQSRVREAEVYNMQNGVPGRVQSITNVHNPSIEAVFHLALGKIASSIGSGISVSYKSPEFLPKPPPILKLMSPHHEFLTPQ